MTAARKFFVSVSSEIIAVFLCQYFLDVSEDEVTLCSSGKESTWQPN